jgi:hypothetical protein
MRYNPGSRSGRALRREDLFGCRSINYDRWSTVKQGEDGRDSRTRQGRSHDEIVADFRLIPHPRYATFEDAGRSASKGYHRTKGKFGELLTLTAAGTFQGARPVVLVVEHIDRLSREGALMGLDGVRTFVDNNVVLVTGDGSIWCPVSINEDGNHKLIAELNSAKKYTDRLRDYSLSGHEKRRSKFEAVAADSTARRPRLNGRPAFWLRPLHGQDNPGPDGFWFELNEKAAIMQRIVREAGDMRSLRQIAAGLNKDGITVPGSGGIWLASKVGALLRDRRVLGLYTPMQWVEKDGKRARQVVGPEVQMAPPAVSEAEWYKARDAIEAQERRVKGRTGTHINLFTGRMTCPTCRGRLRLAAGGSRSQPKKQWICTAYHAAGGACQDRTRHDLSRFEGPILGWIVQLTEIAPSATPADTTALDAERAKLRKQIEWIERERARLEGPRETEEEERSNSQDRSRLGAQKVGLERQETELREKIALATTAVSRVHEKRDFLRQMIRPAVDGDAAAREQVRSMLAGAEYEIIGDPDGMWVVVGAERRFISRDPDADLSPVLRADRFEAEMRDREERAPETDEEAAARADEVEREAIHQEESLNP